MFKLRIFIITMGGKRKIATSVIIQVAIYIEINK
jgi:hypothetical protein